MRTTVTLDDATVAKAAELTGLEETAALVREGLETLIRVESAREAGSPRRHRQERDRCPASASYGVILVDTSVWIDHLHDGDSSTGGLAWPRRGRRAPARDRRARLGQHQGSSSVFSEWLGNLRTVPGLSHPEYLELVNSQRLWGRGLNAVDVHLLGSAIISPGVALWTRDRRLKSVAAELTVELAT